VIHSQGCLFRRYHLVGGPLSLPMAMSSFLILSFEEGPRSAGYWPDSETTDSIVDSIEENRDEKRI